MKSVGRNNEAEPYSPVGASEREKMAPQSKFQSDFLISCRRAAIQSPDCWVDEFERALKLNLSEHLVGDTKFWRDTESKPLGEIWKQATARNIDDAANDWRVNSCFPTPGGSLTMPVRPSVQRTAAAAS